MIASPEMDLVINDVCVAMANHQMLHPLWRQNQGAISFMLQVLISENQKQCLDTVTPPSHTIHLQHTY